MRQTVTLRGGSLRMNYLVFAPEKTSAELPLILFLHGAGERGSRVEHVCRHGIPKLIRAGAELPAVVLCPQCHEAFVWNNLVEEVKALTDRVAAEYAVKPDRITVTGPSMGGFGTWEMAMTYPDFFAAAAPVSGGGLSWRASNLATTPIFAYHGSADVDVPPIYSRLMVDAVNAHGGRAELHILEGRAHGDGIDFAYEKTDLIARLLAARRTDFTPVEECLKRYF